MSRYRYREEIVALRLACALLALACAAASNSAPSESCFSLEHATDVYFLRCLFCSTPRFTAFIVPSTWCATVSVVTKAEDDGASLIAGALLAYAEKIHGVYWRNDTAANVALTHMLRYMPKRDSLLLFTGGDRFLVDFLLEEHVRLSLETREMGPGWARKIPEDIFLDYVLPYAFLNEKRDVQYRWRAKFLGILSNAGVYKTETVTEAMKLVAELLPRIALDEALFCKGCGIVLPDGAATDFVPGKVITWVTSTAPMNLSPQVCGQALVFPF